MLLREVRIILLPLPCRFPRNYRTSDPQRPPSHQRSNISLTRTFKIIKIIKSLANSRSSNQHTMLPHQQDRLVTKHLTNTLRFIPEPHTIKPGINSNALKKPHAILIDRRQDRIVETRQHRRIFRMHMQHAPSRPITLMNLRMKRPRRDIRRARLIDRLRIIRIHNQQITGLDPRKVPAARVNKKLRAIVTNSKAEMIGNGLMHTETRRPTERTGQIDPALLMLERSGS